LVHKLENIFLIAFEEETLQSKGVKEDEKVGKIVKTDISGTLGQESSMIANLNQDDSTQSELVPEGVQRIIITPSGKIISIIPRGGENNQPGKPSKFGPCSKARGAAKRDFARRQAGKNPTSRQSGGGLFTDAFPVKPQYPGRPGGLEPFGRVPPKLWT
jgi:hypothetical protein